MKSLSILLLFICIAVTVSLAQSTSHIQKADSLFILSRKLILKGKNDSAAYVIQQGLSLSEKIGLDSFHCKFNLEKTNLVNINGDKTAPAIAGKAGPVKTKAAAHRAAVFHL